MSHALLLVNTFAAAWADAFLRACWQGGLGITLAWLICRLWPSLPPAPRGWLWRLAYAKLLLGLVWLPPLALPILPQRHASAPPPLKKALQVPLMARSPAWSATALVSPLGVTTLSPLPKLKQTTTPPTRPTVQTWLLAAWLLGALVNFGQVPAAWHRARHLCRASAPLTDAALQADAAALCRRLRLSRVPPLRVAGGLGSPLLLWWGKSAILLPTSILTGCPRSEIRLMLAHELTHLARRDLLWNGFPLLTQHLFFFHPLVWLAGHEWALAQEIACDAEAIEMTGTPPAAYGRMLLGIATRRPASAASLFPTLAVAAPRHTLRRRLFAMQHLGTTSRPHLIRAAALTALLAVGGLLPWQVVAQSRQVNAKATQTNHSILALEQITPIMAEALDKEIIYREKYLQSVEQRQASYLAAHPHSLSAKQQADLSQLQYLEIQRNDITAGIKWGEVVQAKLTAHLAEAHDARSRKGFQTQITAIDANRTIGEVHLPNLERRIALQKDLVAAISRDQREETVKKSQFNSSVALEKPVIAFLKARRAGRTWAQVSIASPTFTSMRGSHLHSLRLLEQKAQWDKDVAGKYVYLLATLKEMHLIAPIQDQWFRQMRSRNAAR